MTNKINRMTEVKMSEVLHLAADKYLAEDCEYDWVLQDKFSCIAIIMAVKELIPSQKIADSFYNRIRIGLEKMGIDTYRGSQFNEFGDYLTITKASQGARYTWLKFAAMIAEEQGV